MQTRLAFVSGVLAALPGLVLFGFGLTAIVEIVGVVIIALGVMLAIASLFSSRASALAWLALILSLFALILGNGYISTSLGVSIGFDPGLALIFGLSIVLIELSIAGSSIHGAYRKYFTDMKKAGYDTEESDRELGAFSNFMFLAAVGVAVVSGVIFFLFEFLPQIPIDSISGLVVAMIVYFIVAMYVLRRPATTATRTSRQ